MGHVGKPAGSWRGAFLAFGAMVVLAAGLIALGLRSHRVRLWQGARALEAGRLAEANSILVPMVKAGDTRAVTLLARLRLRQGRPAFTVDLLEPRLKGERVADWLAPLGEAYLALGRQREAWAVFREAVSVRPTDVAVLARYAELTYLVVGLAQAIEVYEHLERLEPRASAWPRARGRILMEVDGYDMAANAFRAAVALDPADIDLRFELAEADYLRGDLAASLANLDRCVTAHPVEARFATARAECLHALGRREEAARAVDGVLERDPRSPRALRLRAAWHLERLEPLPAMDLLERALEVDPNDWRARYQLAVAYEKLGRDADARVQSERARADQGSDRNRH